MPKTRQFHDKELIGRRKRIRPRQAEIYLVLLSKASVCPPGLSGLNRKKLDKVNPDAGSRERQNSNPYTDARLLREIRFCLVLSLNKCFKMDRTRHFLFRGSSLVSYPSFPDFVQLLVLATLFFQCRSRTSCRPQLEEELSTRRKMTAVSPRRASSLSWGIYTVQSVIESQTYVDRGVIYSL